MMMDACSMVTEWCDYDMSGDVEWCEFIKCANEAGDYFGCKGVCDTNPAENGELDYYLHWYCGAMEPPMEEYCFCDESGSGSMCTEN